MIVKLKYFKPKRQKKQTSPKSKKQKKRTLKQRIKANARYIAHRRGKDGEKMSREYFGHDGKLEKEQIYTMVDTMPKGTIPYTMMISPNRKTEDWDKALKLRQLTYETIAEFEKTIGQPVQFFAAIHNADHTPNRHIHATVLVPGRLSREVFNALPGNLLQAATDEALLQREQLGQTLGYDHQPQQQAEPYQLEPDTGTIAGKPAKWRGSYSETSGCLVCMQTSPWHEEWCPFGQQLGREVGMQL